MIELLTSPEAWASLATLTILEIVLGIDNLVFLTILSQRAPEAQQPMARRIGLVLALLTRIALLLSLSWLMGLNAPLFEVVGHTVSWRDLILISGGVFLLYKATREIHQEVEGEAEYNAKTKKELSFLSVVLQIAVLDIVFSLDSVLTAVGMADHVPIMILAIVIAIFVMLFSAEPIAAFIEKNPTIKMLALSFLLLIGMALIADGLSFHIPKGYLYFAIAFSLLVEALNMVRKRRRANP